MTLTKYNLTRGNTSSSWLSFLREVPTFEPTGTPVGKGKPRWGFTKTIAGLWGDEEILTNLTGLDHGSIVAAGYDEVSGTSPNPVLVSRAGSEIRFNWGPTLSSHTGRTFYSKYQLFLGNRVRSGPDIRSLRSDFQDTPGTVAFVPITGIICFGTLIIICQKHEYDATSHTWVQTGVAVAYNKNEALSTTDGPEFEIFYDDTSSGPIAPGDNRLNTWVCTGWYSPGYLGNVGERPSEVIVPFTDYQNAPDGANPPVPQGGRAFWFKMKRNGTTGRYDPVMAGTNPAMAVLNLPANGYFEPTGSDHARYMHIHAAGITEYADKWQVIVASGDEANSMIRVLVNDTSDTGYFDPANWTVINNWHGTIDTSIRTPPTAGAGYPLKHNGNTGNQFVGVGPGPTSGTLLLGGDAIGEGSWIMTPGSATSTPKHEAFIGSAGVKMERPASFHIRTDRPDLEFRTVLMDETRSITYNGGVPPETPSNKNRRKLNDFAFSYQSGSQGSWGFVPQTGYLQSAFTIGGYVYLATDEESNSIVRRKLPSTIQGEPLQVGPGGRQWLINSPTTYFPGPSSQTNIIPCHYNTFTNKWEEMSATGSPGATLDPQPPSNVAAVFRMTKVRNSTSASQICFLGPTRQNSSDPGVLPTEQLLGLGLRYWMRSNSAHQSDSPQRNSPINRSCSSAPVWFQFAAGLSDPYIVTLGDNNVVGDTARWQCYSLAFLGKIQTGIPEQFAIRSATYGGGPTDPEADADTDFYLAVSEFCAFGAETTLLAGVETFGYPLPARDPSVNPTSYATFPPERATVEHVFEDSFTLYFAGMVPEDAWDQYSKYDLSTEPLFPLLTIVNGDETKFLSINARPDNDDGVDFAGRYTFTTQAGGPTWSVVATPFMRGRALVGAVTYDAETDIAKIYLCHNGRYLPVTTLSSMGWAGHELKRIRFGDQRDSDISRVGSFQWFGLAIDKAPNTESQIKDQFNSLDFLKQ